MGILNLFGEIANKVVAFVLVILVISLLSIHFYMAGVRNKTRIVAEVISAEACSEGPHAMMGVASTIKNRMVARGLSAYEVVTEPKQYAGFTNVNREKIFSDARCSEPALLMAEHIEDMPDIVAGAIYFKTPDEKLRPWHKIKTVQIGKLEFYK
jgi:spore germination cell wall hydrolase CwlJ-like protein